MAYFVVTYDLVTEEEFDYQRLWDALAAFDSQKYQLSCYLVDANATATGLFNHLRQFMHDVDRLMVVEFSKKPAWKKGLPGTKAWLDARFP
ncbi:MAG: hypothetical protein J0J01_10600 [Reyranella sp.]|uniref:hypothetical protein n=1 Tax=Reyranella sp. TaxID=1929291 RepID=UPI001AC09931|nr:hypothetical protein [Reyranella sp.]MBN9087345.1 hypothetical protein [Reyranella sp.]